MVRAPSNNRGARRGYAIGTRMHPIDMPRNISNGDNTNATANKPLTTPGAMHAKKKKIAFPKLSCMVVPTKSP